MAYVKQEWKDEVLNGAEKYKITRSDGTILAENVSIELITQILQAGTPITAERMNHIEDGIANCAEKIHAVSHAKNGADPITPESIGAMSKHPPSIELSGYVGGGGYIDFHFNDDMAVDYTARIGEFSPGTVSVAGNLAVNEYISAKNINDSGWINMPPINGWSINPNCLCVYRNLNGIIYFQCVIKPNTAGTGHFFTFPVGSRPKTQAYFVGLRDGTTPIHGCVDRYGVTYVVEFQWGNYISFSGQFPADN